MTVRDQSMDWSIDARIPDARPNDQNIQNFRILIDVPVSGYCCAYKLAYRVTLGFPVRDFQE